MVRIYFVGLWACAAALAALMLAQPAHAVRPANQPLPPDVQTLINQRAMCEHWRGEEAYDAARRAEITLNACQSCRGTDARLRALKKKYRSDSAEATALGRLEPTVESPDTRAVERACRAAKKGPRAAF